MIILQYEHMAKLNAKLGYTDKYFHKLLACKECESFGTVDVDKLPGYDLDLVYTKAAGPHRDDPWPNDMFVSLVIYAKNIQLGYFDNKNPVYKTLDPGDMVIIDPMVLHWALPEKVKGKSGLVLLQSVMERGRTEEQYLNDFKGILDSICN